MGTGRSFISGKENIPKKNHANRLLTGVEGLDEILSGGLIPNRLYLIEGDPGSGKTTIGLQFVLEGVRRGEDVLYVTLSETAEELHAVAESHGWSLEGVRVCELTPPESALRPDHQYTLLHPSEVELGETTQMIFDQVQLTNPSRVVFDSLSEIRLLAQDPLRYRRQVLALKQFFIGRQCTVLLLDDRTAQVQEIQLHSISHGVIVLDHLAREYGAERRRLRVVKLRGSGFRGGYHDSVIRRGGVTVFPRLELVDYVGSLSHMVSSGVKELDALLGGGVHRGTSMLLMGPAGVGKSTLGTKYISSALERGERAAVYTFDEGRAILLERSASLGIDLNTHLKSGSLTVLSILVVAQHGLVGQMQTPADLSYLTDTVVLVRYFESRGSVKKAISVIKKRCGGHEDTIRELRLSSSGIQVGPPLTEFQGVLTGVPTYVGGLEPLLRGNHGGAS